MKKKFKYLLFLISLIVLSSVLLCSGLSVNAASVITPQIEPGTYYLTGIDLYDFLMTYYTVEIGISDTYNDWSNNVQWLDKSKFEYQFVASDIDDNVYFTFNFPNINGVPSPIKGKYYVIRFRSDYTSKYGRPMFAFNLFQTTIYKRFVINNGDYTDGDNEPYLSLELSTNEYPSGIKFEKEIDSYDYYDFPLLNQGSTVVDGKTINPWINPTAPYQRDSSGNFKFSQAAADFLSVDFNSVRDGYGEYEQLFDISIIYGSANHYINGAVQFAIEPITLVVTESYIDMTEFEDNLIYPTKPDADYTSGIQSGANSTHNAMNGISSSIDESVSSINTSTDRPSFNIWDLVSFRENEGLAGGLNTFINNTSHLFSGVAILYFLAPTVPPLIVSYLLFGKKG